MDYFINETTFDIDMIIKRIKNADLIPSFECLKMDIEKVINILEKNGISNLAGLRNSLKTKMKIAKISVDHNIDENYLIILKREIEGWIAKVRKIDEFFWIDTKYLKILKTIGITNSEEAFNILSTKKKCEEISKEYSISYEILIEISEISNLLRIRWLSPNFTRIIRELGYSILKLQKADPKKLTEEIDKYNKEKGYYKGKVGERDVTRLIYESQFV